MNESTMVPREEMSDLDWLALNVNEWREGANYICVNHSDGGHVFHEHNRNCAVWFSRNQWLTRRAELLNKPSWEDAPVWANALAQDQDGEWKWLGGNVTQYVDGFSADKIRVVCSGVVLSDWSDTLEKRPERAEFEPFVSVEDAATSKQYDPVNSPSHYASGGIECIEAIKASMSHEAFLGYLKGNVQKYMWRYEKKVNPSEDLKKARWYLSKLIEEQE